MSSLETSMTHGDDHPRKIRNIQSKSLNKSLALKQIKESVMKSVLTSGSKDKSIHGGDRKCFRCDDLNHLIRECPKPLKDKNQRAFVEGIWSDSGEEDDEKVKDETCLVAHASSEICLRVDLEPDEWINDSGCSKHMTGNQKLFSTYKAYNGGNVIFGSNLCGNIISKGTISNDSLKLDNVEHVDNSGFNLLSIGQICNNKCRVTFSEHDSEITKDGKVIGRGIRKKGLHVMKFGSYSQNSKAYIFLNKHTRKVEESLNVTFDETPPPSKTSPLVDDDLDEEESIKVTEKKNLENDIVDETLEVDEIINIKESRNHPLENVIGNLNQRTLRLVGLRHNQQEGIDYDETYAPVARLESIRILLAYACALDFKLFQMDVKSAFLNGFINEEKSSNLIIVQIYVDDIIFGLTCQDMCDEFAKIMHDEFEMSMMGELNFFLGLQIKQMEDGIFFNQSKYIKEMLKKFGLKESKPMKTPMSSDTKLMKDEECESVDSTKYQGMIGSLLYLTASRPDIMFSVCLCARFQEAPKTSHLEAVKCIFRYIKGTTHLGLWYPKGTGIETVVYADSDYAEDFVDRKSTSGICTFVGCYLTSWFSKKQTDLSISTTEAEYVSTRKACQ
ncbi:retrovirus-related pol polyprotein from transposon TNT 1-94 [Tanacetum coccineum]